MPAVVNHHQVVIDNLQKLIDGNRDKLITSTVPDQKVRAKLLEINKLINEVKAVDPGKVAAWGLGCGGSCLAPPGGFGEIKI